jgi:hypothetical protein
MGNAAGPHYLAVQSAKSQSERAKQRAIGQISHLRLAFLGRLHKSGAIGCPRLLA